MRPGLVLSLLLLAALAAQGVTPEVGKDKLRRLVKLPTIAFEAEWKFDPERGFTLGSAEKDARAQIADLRSGLKRDMSDAEAYESLADLYASISEYKNAGIAWARAVELYRQRVELQPDNGLLLSGLGRALEGTGEFQEAESLLRQALRASPKSWQCELALGRFLDSRAREDILDRPHTAPSPGAISDHPASADVALAGKRLDEAGGCFDRAVALAPGEPEVYFRRALHRCLRKAVLKDIGLNTGDSTEETGPFSDFFSRESLADLQRASRLSPQDYQLIGAAALFEIYGDNTAKGRADGGDLSWNSLPDKSQRSVREAMTRLENLAQNPDPRVASGALETLGILQGPALHDPSSCITQLRRALALDPSRELSWEMLVGSLARSGRYEEMLATCEDRARRDDTSHSHLLLAKAYERLRQWENCEEEARIAVQEDGNNFAADLSLGALLLRQGQDASTLAEANDWLTKAEQALNKVPAPQRGRQQIIELTLTRSIYLALTDDVETARQWAKAVVELDKENTQAQEILGAMDY